MAIVAATALISIVVTLYLIPDSTPRAPGLSLNWTGASRHATTNEDDEDDRARLVT